MSSASDSENAALSGSVDVTGGSDSGSSSSASSSGESSSASSSIQPTARAPPPPPEVVVVEEGSSSEGTNSGASISGQERTESSESTAPEGEPVGDRDRPAGQVMRINDRRVYRRSDQEMSALAGDRPVYSADYYTSAVTARYLTGIRRDYGIPDAVELRVPGANDLPSRPPEGFITLSAEYFRAGLRLPLHPFLRRALARLNVAPAQLNANAFRVLVSSFVLWAKHYITEMPFEAFQNFYRMKSAPSSSGSYYFQGIEGAFIEKCPDSDKQFKHLWFYAGGRWLHGHSSRDELPRDERVPITFRRGYAWTRAPHIPERTLRRVEELRALGEVERDQRVLLGESSLKEHGWLGFSSTSDRPPAAEEVTVARMPEPAVHYTARTDAAQAETAPAEPEVPAAVPRVSSPESWGPRVADEDVGQVIQRLYPARGLRIEGRRACSRVLVVSG